MEVLVVVRVAAGAAPELSRILEDELGVSLEPMHPGANEPELMDWFTLAVEDRTVAERAIALLQNREEVKSAYIKPPDEMP